MKKIAIIGGGGWGTALAIVLSRSQRQHRISLWVHDEDVAGTLLMQRRNDVYLPGFLLPPEVEVTRDFRLALADAGCILGVMPSAHARNVYRVLLPHLRTSIPIISATKGIEQVTLLRMTQVIGETLGPEFSARIAVLSGPSFASEVAHGDPTAVVIASENEELSAEIQAEFSGGTFRLYTNRDVIGAELGGAVKNVIAIAAGAAEGLGLGHNALAALITRGLAEMMRLGKAMGAKTETLAGLAGLGDLVLTCTGSLSRNRTVGIELGRGRKLADILKPMRMVAEGVSTTEAVWKLAQRHGVAMPITEQMHGVLSSQRSPKEAIHELMSRPLKNE